jgi:membrane-associated protein
MEFTVLDFVLHIDRHLADWVRAFPDWVYALLFLILFAETGLVVMGMLPGDSLIFAAGALAAGHGLLDLRVLLPLFFLAALAGDQVNYLIGRLVGDAPFKHRRRFFNRKTLDRGRRFYGRHGGEAVLLGRFIPVLRSIMPLAAAISGMAWWRFLAYSLAGTLLWVSTFLLTGYFLGNLPWVRGRFAIVLGAVILISLLPGLVQILVERYRQGQDSGGRGGGRRHRHAPA